MESVVNRQLINHLEYHHLLSTRQYGFRCGLGTADLLTAPQHEWAQASGSGGRAHVLAVDIAGAFESPTRVSCTRQKKTMASAENC